MILAFDQHDHVSGHCDVDQKLRTQQQQRASAPLPPGASADRQTYSPQESPELQDEHGDNVSPAISSTSHRSTRDSPPAAVPAARQRETTQDWSERIGRDRRQRLGSVLTSGCGSNCGLSEDDKGIFPVREPIWLAQFQEQRFVSGHAFRHAARICWRLPGFSRCNSRDPAQRLKPFRSSALSASLKRCPDTNRPFKPLQPSPQVYQPHTNHWLLSSRSKNTPPAPAPYTTSSPSPPAPACPAPRCARLLRRLRAPDR